MNARILVDGRGLDAALRALKKTLTKDGWTRELKRRQQFTPPSVLRRQKAKAARGRERKRRIRQHVEQGTQAERPQQGRRLTRAIRKRIKQRQRT